MKKNRKGEHTTMCIIHKGFRGFRAASSASILGGNLIGWKPAIPYEIIHSTLWAIKMKQQLTIVSVLGLVCGGLLYFFFRSTTLVMFNWLDNPIIFKPIHFIRQFTLPLSKNIPDWILFSLPDGLWAFSYVGIILAIWNGELNRKSIFWLLLVPVFIITHEFLQLIALLKGTFDFYDLIFYITGTLTPLIIFKHNLTFKIQKL